MSIISFTSVIGAPVRIASASFNKILMLAQSKLNSIDTLISQALIDMEISHEEFITILKEKDRYEMMKDKNDKK